MSLHIEVCVNLYETKTGRTLCFMHAVRSAGAQGHITLEIRDSDYPPSCDDCEDEEKEKTNAEADDIVSTVIKRVSLRQCPSCGAQVKEARLQPHSGMSCPNVWHDQP